MAGDPTTLSEPLVIYHIEGRRSLRVIWLCEEAGLPYRLVYTLGDVLGSMVEIRKAFPQMPMAPVVVADGQHLVESGAILEFLNARYAGGRYAPSIEAADFAAHLQWMHFAEGTLLARIATNRFVSMATGIPVNALPAGYRASVDPPNAPKMLGTEQIFAFLDEFLSAHPYCGGREFGIADMMMHFAVRGVKLTVGVDPMDYPAIRTWLETIEARPAYERALKAACPTGVVPETLLPSNQPLLFKFPKPLTSFQRFKYDTLFKIVMFFRKPA